MRITLTNSWLYKMIESEQYDYVSTENHEELTIIRKHNLSTATPQKITHVVIDNGTWSGHEWVLYFKLL